MTAAVTATWMGAAVAADLPSRDKAGRGGPVESAEPEEEEPPRIPVFTWTGAYAGLQAGAAFGHESLKLVQPAVAGPGFADAPRGIIGGAHVGYNQGVARVGEGHEVVLGLEGDVDGADYGRAAQAYGRAFRAESDLKGSLRGRVGVAASRVLVFATGGVTFADVATDNRAPGAAVRATHSPVGYTLGAGVEYAFTNSYALRAEYRASAYRAFATPLDASAAGLAAAVSRRETDNRLQAGISYRFGPLVPAAEAALPQ